MRSLLLLLAVVALLAAGCGARTSAPFTAKSTAACLKEQGFTQVTTATRKVGLIAGFAANGGLTGVSTHGNRVTVAFTAGPDEVTSTERAFRRSAPPILKAHFSDVLRSNRNAVIVWTTSPADADASALNGCLRP